MERFESSVISLLSASNPFPHPSDPPPASNLMPCLHLFPSSSRLFWKCPRLLSALHVLPRIPLIFFGGFRTLPRTPSWHAQGPSPSQDPYFKYPGRQHQIAVLAAVIGKYPSSRPLPLPDPSYMVETIREAVGGSIQKTIQATTTLTQGARRPRAHPGTATGHCRQPRVDGSRLRRAPWPSAMATPCRKP